MPDGRHARRRHGGRRARRRDGRGGGTLQPGRPRARHPSTVTRSEKSKGARSRRTPTDARTIHAEPRCERPQRALQKPVIQSREKTHLLSPAGFSLTPLRLYSCPRLLNFPLVLHRHLSGHLLSNSSRSHSRCAVSSLLPCTVSSLLPGSLFSLSCSRRAGPWEKSSSETCESSRRRIKSRTRYKINSSYMMINEE